MRIYNLKKHLFVYFYPSLIFYITSCGTNGLIGDETQLKNVRDRINSFQSKINTASDTQKSANFQKEESKNIQTTSSDNLDKLRTLNPEFYRFLWRSDITNDKQLSEIERLTINSNTAVSDLSGISFLTSLKFLYIENVYSPSSLSEISSLTNLESLTIHKSKVYNIDFIKSLETLEILDLERLEEFNKDMSPISKLINLRKIRCVASNIDSNSLQNIVWSSKLKEVDLSHNAGITDIDTFQNNENIVSLNLRNTKIYNFDTISSILNLESFIMDWIARINYDFVSKLSRLKNLEVGNNIVPLDKYKNIGVYLFKLYSGDFITKHKLKLEQDSDFDNYESFKIYDFRELQAVHHFPKLRSVTITGFLSIYMDAIEKKALLSIPKLDLLMISGSSFVNKDVLYELLKLDQFKKIVINNSSLSEKGIKFPEMKSLEELEITSNEHNNNPIDLSFGKLPNLKRIVIHQNTGPRIRLKNLCFLKSSPNLEELSFKRVKCNNMTIYKSRDSDFVFRNLKKFDIIDSDLSADSKRQLAEHFPSDVETKSKTISSFLSKRGISN